MNDPLEAEADHVADEVMRMPDTGVSIATVPPQVSRKCASFEEEEDKKLQAKSVGAPVLGEAAPIVHDVLRSPGQPLDAPTRCFFEPRFGSDFSWVRVHSDALATQSAGAVNALAYTVGHKIVLGAGASNGPTRLLAHELAHVVQQAEGEPLVQRQDAGGGAAGGGVGSGAGGAPACAIPSHCPARFCTPFPGGKLLAGLARNASAPTLLAGIAAKVSPRVVSLWSQYLFGGAAPQDLSKTFGADFTSSVTTVATTDFLASETQKSIESSPPVGAGTVNLDLTTLIPVAIGAIGTPGDPHEMNFDAIGEIPGNIAGGIGKDQTTCPVGALPSPFDDDRTASGNAVVTPNPDGSLNVVLSINYVVRDTIDLCPGDCGAPVEQLATVPMSTFEASGVSGDVPFTVNFPAPARTFTAHPATPPSPTPTPTPTPTPSAGPYTVQSGDTLSGIAAKVYGDANQWQKIYQANQAVIGSDPNLIFPGQVLTIP